MAMTENMIDTVEVELDTPVELNDAELDAVAGGTGTLSPF